MCYDVIWWPVWWTPHPCPTCHLKFGPRVVGSGGEVGSDPEILWIRVPQVGRRCKNKFDRGSNCVQGKEGPVYW